MDAIEILGGLLRNKTLASGVGKSILRDILGGSPEPRRDNTADDGGLLTGGRARREPPPLSGDLPRAGGGGTRDPLDMIRHAIARHERRTGERISPDTRATNAPRPASHRRDVAEQLDPGPCPTHDEASILIRAMIMAAKADNRVDRQEYEAISQQLGPASEQDIAFVRSEFDRQMSVEEFARSVPEGLREQAYVVSLAAIELDDNTEARYLHALAHELGLSHQWCNAIHARVGAPQLYR